MVLKPIESTRGSGYPMLQTTNSWESITTPCPAPGLAAGEGLESFCPYPAQKPLYFPLGDTQNHKSPGAERCVVALEGHGATPEGISESSQLQREQLRQLHCSPEEEGGEPSPSRVGAA